MNQKKSDDLEKKSRELEEREQVLNKRENLLEREKALEKRQKVFSEAETKLDILNKQIKAKEGLLEAFNDDVTQKRTEIEKTINTLLAQREATKKACEAQEGVLSDLKRQEINAASNVRAKKSELSDIQLQVKETKEYLKEQERLTSDTIAEWNSNLVEFRKEAELIQSEKNKLSGDIIRLEQEKLAMADESEKIESKIERLSVSYEQKVEDYKQDLRKLDVLVSDKRNELDSLDAALKMREVEFSTREKSLRLKENSIKGREHELDQKERRLKMNYNMADIPYDGV